MSSSEEEEELPRRLVALPVDYPYDPVEEDYPEEVVVGAVFPDLVNCVAVVHILEDDPPLPTPRFLAWHCSGATMRMLIELEKQTGPNFPGVDDNEHVWMLQKIRSSRGKTMVWGVNANSTVRDLFRSTTASPGTSLTVQQVPKEKKYLTLFYMCPGPGIPDGVAELTQSDTSRFDWDSMTMIPVPDRFTNPPPPPGGEGGAASASRFTSR